MKNIFKKIDRKIKTWLSDISICIWEVDIFDPNGTDVTGQKSSILEHISSLRNRLKSMLCGQKKNILKSFLMKSQVKLLLSLGTVNPCSFSILTKLLKRSNYD